MEVPGNFYRNSGPAFLSYRSLHWSLTLHVENSGKLQIALTL